jgi:hypothetical protein
MPTAIITHSLGAYILMDATRDLSGDDPEHPTVRAPRNAALLALKHLNSFDWLANQMPLLDLTTLKGVPEEAAGNARPVAAEGFRQALSRFSGHWRRQRQQANRTELPLRIVAVSDPNDVLSYVVSPRDSGGPAVPLYNVFLANAEINWFDLFANPFTAHTGYLANDDAMDVIVCGMKDGAISPCHP